MSYAAVLDVATALMLVSSIVFTAMGKPKRAAPPKATASFAAYLKEGAATFRNDAVFRRFVFAQSCGGALLAAVPFFVVAADKLGMSLQNVALLLGAQKAGALLSNPLRGWWGDRLGKLSLMRVIAAGRIASPVALLMVPASQAALMPMLLAVFLLLGALANGLTIAVIGLLMERSPEDRRPAYSSYFDELTAPVFVLPFVGGFAVAALDTWIVFLIALAAALEQTLLLARVEAGQDVDGH
ncbi:MFS transporter [Limimaricola hongkongensis]|uniref:Major facilitator superfamily (MFS) profile domain-containing protein n=1 Tax=Limimaricola hongkongensis DSM 17492 TaxID=1122180 RepID=A0A017HAQ3_9RHOB|nr:MFS transporter [Limimaricola hongkongensis]EYD71456.1 hypothetical protein Lokhon_03105 [Limimaricola hongkongensis DSM 17492]